MIRQLGGRPTCSLFSSYSSTLTQNRCSLYSYTTYSTSRGVLLCNLALQLFHFHECHDTRNSNAGLDWIVNGRTLAFVFLIISCINHRAAKTKVLKYPKKMSPDFMTFGVPTRPSTPVYDLLENSYQERWIRWMRDAEQAQREQEKQAKRSNNIQDTRTSLMRKKVVKVEDSKQWHMSKWGKVRPFLNTFPSEKEKIRAMRRHNQQKTA